MIGQTISHYKILEKLGQGGMGIVYKAHDTKLDRDVALKFLPPHLHAGEAEKARFIQEAKAAAALNHPNICSVIDIDEHAGPSGEPQMFIVMEFIDGQTLKDLSASASGATLPLKRAIEIGIQMAEGLAAAHEKGIVHRDIKPENIMIRKDGIVQIMDFGLAKLKSSGSKITRLTREGSTVGTAGYMSPEQVQGQDVDHRSDIFSLGVVLYEIFTGQMPFKGVHDTALMYEIVNVDPAPMTAITPALDPNLDAIVLDCLEKDPKERCQSVAEVARDLRRLKRESTRQRHSRVTQVLATQSAASATQTAGPVAAPAMRKWLIPAVTGVLGILSVVFLVLWLKSGSGGHVVSRLSLALPKSLDVNIGSYTALAISPDGSKIVIRAGGKLYLRSIDSYEITEISGTGEAGSPFFSPDGQWLAFFADGKLKKVPLVGGTAITLADVPDNRGGSWGADGTIIFSPGPANGLVKVSDQGGTPQGVTTVDTAHGDRTHRFPFILPGGKGVIYTVGTLDNPDYYEDATIAATELSTGKQKVVLKGASYAVYVPSGYLVYAHSGTLFSVPFDAGRMEVTGAAFPVVEGVRGDPTTGASDFAVSQNGTLVYLPGRTSAEERSLAKLDLNGGTVVLPAKPQFYIEPRISPSGNDIALVIQSGKDFDIWVYDIPRGTLSRLTFGGLNRTPTWSPDGTKIAYFTIQNGKSAIMVKHSDGSGEAQELAVGLGRTYIHSWSKDGSFLIVDKLLAAQGDVVVVPLAPGKQPWTFLGTKYDEWMGALSPDGKWIAYCSNESERYQIYIQTFPGGGGKWQVTSEESYEPHWSPDGKTLYYYTPGRLMAVDIQTIPTLVIGKPRAIAAYPNFPIDSGVSYDLSPDGKSIITTTAKEDDDLLHQVHVVLNWTDEIRQRTPPAR